MNDITSANLAAYMTVRDLFPAGFELQQFSVNNAVAQGDDTYAETRMTVDGQMVAGYTPSIKTVTIVLEPSSPSIKYFDTLIKAEAANKRKYRVDFSVTYPSTGMIRQYSKGVLKTGKLVPDAQATLQPITYTFDFESVK